MPKKIVNKIKSILGIKPKNTSNKSNKNITSNNTNNKRKGRPPLVRQDATTNFSNTSNNRGFSHRETYPVLINVNKIEPKKHTVKYWNKYYSFINSTSRDALRQMGNNGIESQILLNNNKIDNGEKITSSEYELLKKK